jgi:hypothetical protein
MKINIIDVGAVGGFDPPWSKHRDKIGASLSFEPNEPPIFQGNHLRYNSAVWNYDGEGTFFVSGEKGIGSSLLKQNVDWVRENFDRLKDQGDRVMNASWFERSQIRKTAPCRVCTLDSVLDQIRQQGREDLKFHFIKSDTQSGEFPVLDGARRFLKDDCLGLELELFRYPIYEGIVTEEEVKAFLKAEGFEIAGWSGYQNSFEATADYLFLRSKPRSSSEASMIEQIRTIYQPHGKERLIKQLSLGTRFLLQLRRVKRRLFNQANS